VRITGVFEKVRHELDLTAEVESHLQLHIDDNFRAGMSYYEARRAALLKLGGVELLKETYRDRRGLPALENLLWNLRFTVRDFRKNPGFALLAIGIFTLAIGASTALFSLIEALLALTSISRSATPGDALRERAAPLRIGSRRGRSH
jgi:macrolide transport system ATP-binding/permease protein